MSSDLSICRSESCGSVLVDYEGTHKVKHTFNERACGVPDIIFLLERHRHGYDPMPDRLKNDEIIDALYTEKSVVLVEQAAGEPIDTATYVRTKHWTVTRRVEGCFNGIFLQASNLTLQSYHQIAGINNDIQEQYSGLLYPLILSVRALYDKILFDATMHHTDMIIKKVSELSGEGPVFVVIGKNHASFSKRDKDCTAESLKSVQRIHEFLKVSGKWAVILIPKKT